jgi:hypothetical protein
LLFVPSTNQQEVVMHAALLPAAGPVVPLESLASRFSDRTIREAMLRLRAEYAEMPGLSLTEPQAVRLCGVAPDSCLTALRVLVDQRFLRRHLNATFVRADILG